MPRRQEKQKMGHGARVQVVLKPDKLKATDVICSADDWTRSRAIAELVPTPIVAEALAEFIKAEMTPSLVMRLALDYFLRAVLTTEPFPVHPSQIPEQGLLNDLCRVYVTRQRCLRHEPGYSIIERPMPGPDGKPTITQFYVCDEATVREEHA